MSTSQMDQLELYKNGKDWYRLCSQFGQFHGNVFVCHNCSCQYANVKRTVINHLLKHCLRGDQQKFLVSHLIKIGDTSKYVTDWVDKLNKPQTIPRPIQPMLTRLDSALTLSHNNISTSKMLSKINTNIQYTPHDLVQEDTPVTDAYVHQEEPPQDVAEPEQESYTMCVDNMLTNTQGISELDSVKKLKKQQMGPRNQPPAWKIVSNQYGIFTPMNQTEKKTSRRRFWYTCSACQSRMTENKTGITNHLLKSCLSIDLVDKRKILDLLLTFGEDAPYILKMKHINNDKVHNAGRSARRGSRQSSAGILRGSQNKLKTPFHDQSQRMVQFNQFTISSDRQPTHLYGSSANSSNGSNFGSLDHFPKFEETPLSLSCASSFVDDSSFLALSSFAEMLNIKMDKSSCTTDHDVDLMVVKQELVERKLMIDSRFKNLEKLSKVSVMMASELLTTTTHMTRSF